MAPTGTSESRASSVERPYGWVVIIASLLLMAIGTGGYYVVVVALKSIAAEFGGYRWVPSLAYALAMFGMGAGGILMGKWSDRSGVGWPALVGALMIVLGAWLASRDAGPWLFLLAHGLFIGVLGNAALFTPLVANATHWFDRRRGLAVAVVASGQGLAGALWPPVFHALIAAEGWRQAFVIYAAFALVTMVPLSLALRPRAPAPLDHADDGRARAADGRIFGLPARRVQALLCLAIIGCCVAMAMPMVHVISHANDLGYSLERGAEMLAVLLGCAFLSRIAWGVVSDRIGGLATLVIGSAAQAVMLSSFLVVESLAGLYVVSALYGLAFGGIVPAYSLIVRDLFPVREAGWRIGWIYLFGTIGMAGGGWLGGAIFDLAGSYAPAFALGVGFNLMNLLIAGTLLLRHLRPPLPAAAE